MGIDIKIHGSNDWFRYAIDNIRLNLYKLLRRLSETPDPPCLGCLMHDYCEEHEVFCKVFREYVETGSFKYSDVKRPIYRIKELCKV